MYVRKRTWLESGPGAARALPVPVLVVPGSSSPRMAIPSRGLGRYPGETCYDPNRPTWWPNWFSTPTEDWCLWFGGGVAVDVYERAQYGKVPQVADLPRSPGPNAPQTIPELTIAGEWTPAMTGVTPEQWEKWKADQRAAIAAAEARGEYFPGGRLPFNALDWSDFWKRWGGLIAAAGVGVVGLVAWGAIGGRR